MNHVQLQDHPKHRNQTEDTSFATEIDSDDDDSASDDDGNRGLLTGHGESTYSHERSKPPPAKLWPQVKSIVIEVRVIMSPMTEFSFSVTKSDHLECTHASHDNHKSIVYWKVAGQSIGETTSYDLHHALILTDTNHLYTSYI